MDNGHYRIEIYMLVGCPNCNVCGEARDFVKKFVAGYRNNGKIDVKLFSLDRPDGMCEEGLRGIDRNDLPVILFVRGHEEVSRLIKKVPSPEELEHHLSQLVSVA